jgi:site-specific DNA-cytosine methylase
MWRLTLEAEGYAVGALDTCAAGEGAPHIRQRLYWVAYAERGATERQRLELVKNGNGFGLTLGMAVTMAGWPTPDVSGAAREMSVDATGRTADGRKHTASLEHAVKFAGWPTPMAGTPATEMYNAAGNTDSSRKTEALLAGWPTATVNDSRNGANRTAKRSNPESAHHDGLTLVDAATLAGWATPAARDHKSESASDEFNRERWEHHRGKPLSAETALVPGLTPTSSDASTGKPVRFRLNPRFSLWLQGYPTAWARCAELVIRSSRKRRPRS